MPWPRALMLEVERGGGWGAAGDVGFPDAEMAAGVTAASAASVPGVPLPKKGAAMHRARTAPTRSTTKEHRINSLEAAMVEGAGAVVLILVEGDSERVLALYPQSIILPLPIESKKRGRAHSFFSVMEKQRYSAAERAFG